MSRLQRISLLVLGLIILALACSALFYVVAPVERQREQRQPAPTLFAPP